MQKIIRLNICKYLRIYADLNKKLVCLFYHCLETFEQNAPEMAEKRNLVL
jgi:hypothetical protein